MSDGGGPGAGALDLRVKRVYELPQPDDGYRILVDRLWPRGVSRERARLDEWARDLAPSTELRQWFHHDPERFSEFRKRYLKELRGHSDQIDELRERASQGPVTIVYGARDTDHNEAVVIADVVRGPWRDARAPSRRLDPASPR